MKYILMVDLQNCFTEENSRLKCFFFPSFQPSKFGREAKSKLLSSNLVSTIASLITPMLHIINRISVFKDGLSNEHNPTDFFLGLFFFSKYPFSVSFQVFSENK